MYLLAFPSNRKLFWCVHYFNWLTRTKCICNILGHWRLNPNKIEANMAIFFYAAHESWCKSAVVDLILFTCQAWMTINIVLSSLLFLKFIKTIDSKYDFFSIGRHNCNGGALVQRETAGPVSCPRLPSRRGNIFQVYIFTGQRNWKMASSGP